MVDAKGYIKSSLNSDNEWGHEVHLSIKGVEHEDNIQKILSNIRDSLVHDQFGNWVYDITVGVFNIETTESANKQLESLINSTGQTVISQRESEEKEKSEKLED